MHYDRGCGCTQGLLLADYLKSILTGQNLPPDLEAQARELEVLPAVRAGPAALGSLDPAELPNSDLTNAFVTQTAGGGQAQRRAAPDERPSRYGFQVHMWDLSDQAKGFIVGDVRQAGFNWLKHQVEWSAIEQSPGQYDWTELDAIVNRADTVRRSR